MLTYAYSIIAVTGLAGHALGSWKSPGRHTTWLRDFLPEDIPNCRILTYGYASTVKDSNRDSSIQDYARQFLEAVNIARQNENVGHFRISYCWRAQFDLPT